MTIAVCGTLIFYLLLYVIGRDEQKRNLPELKSKDYPFRSLIPIGYGVLKLIRIRNFSDDRIYKIFHVRYNNVVKATTVYLNYVAHTITVALTVFLLTVFMSFMLVIKSADAQMIMRLMIIGSAISILLAFAYRFRVIKQEEERKADIVDELPVVLSKLLVLSGSGMPMASAVINIATEKREGKPHPLYEELSDIALVVGNGTKGICDALNDMQMRCQVAQVSKFVTAVNQQISKGTTNDDRSLSDIAHELWKEKKNSARKRCGAIKARLQIPTFVVFGAIMMLIMVSSFMGIMG